MPLSDEQWRFVVEDVLGVRPAQCEALVDAVSRRPAADRARALARAIVPRAMIAGAPSGLAESLPRAVGLALLEQRAMMRHRATLLASLSLLDDPRFFERDDWARQALGLPKEAGALAVVASEGARFGLRLTFVRGSRRAARVLGRRFSSIVGAGAGTLFDAVEIIGFAESALEERESARRRAFERASSARVVPLPFDRARRHLHEVPRAGSTGRGRPEDEETTEGT